jgi:signal transduction histidine kinase
MWCRHSRENGNSEKKIICIPAIAGVTTFLLSTAAFAADNNATEWTSSFVAFLLGAAGVFGYHLWDKYRNAEPDEERSRLVLLFSSANTCFYYQDLQTGKEWFSRKLKALLEIKAKTAGFQEFSIALQESDGDLLRQSIVDLKAGKPEFRLELKSTQGKLLECYGVIKQEHGTNHLILWWQDITERNEGVERLRRESERMKKELQQLSNTLNALHTPIWQRDEQLKIRFSNLAFMEAVDDASDNAQSDALELYSQAKLLAQKARDSKEIAQERHYLILHGERKLYDLYETPSSDGKFTTGVALDASEFEKLREEMEQTRAAQADLLESTTSGMAIYGADQRLKFYNQAFARLWKLEEGWLEAHPKYSEVLEKLRENRVLPEQANFPAFKQQHLKLFTDLLAPHEEFFYLPDGRTIRVLAIPHAMGGVLFAYEDVTDRLALERSYNTLIAVQKETLDNLQEGVAVFGEDGRLKLSNPVYIEMWDLSPEMVASEPHIGDILNRNKPLFLFDVWETFKAEFMEMLSTREMRQRRIERRDGRVFEIIIVPLPDGQTLLNYVDITSAILVERSLREKNEALQEADHLKSEFLANISYELRSPLTSISGFTEMLRQDYFGKLTDQQREYLNNIHEASHHLSTLINDILDVASIEAGYMQLDVRRFDIAAMVAAMPSLIGEYARQEGITLRVMVDNALGKMDGDENRIRQVLFNLINNAVKYSEKGGQVAVGARAQGETIILWVEDSGIGIVAEEQDAVFNKFYRTSEAVRRHSGTGLGLSMVKSFVELHGGHVELTSAAGEGTTVACYFPRYQLDANEMVREAANKKNKEDAA